MSPDSTLDATRIAEKIRRLLVLNTGIGSGRRASAGYLK